jgi:hypothetical protein
MQAIEQSTGHEIDLTVVRAKHTRTVRLSW